MANSKGLEKWFPLIPGYRVHNNIDIQGEIRIEIMFYDQVGEKKWFTISYPLIFILPLPLPLSRCPDLAAERKVTGSNYPGPRLSV